MKTRVLQAPLELVIAFVALLAGIADAATTAIGLHRGASEANPVAAGLFDSLGLVPVLALRVLLPAAIAYVLLRVLRRDRVLQVVAAVTFLVVAAAWLALAVRNSFV